MRGNYTSDEEDFFIFRDGASITQDRIWNFLKQIIAKLNLDPKLYSTHSIRAGQAVDMWRYGYTVEEIQKAGRWRSKAVYRYLRNI